MDNMKCLSREAILNAVDLPREKVDVSEWQGFLYIRTLTGSERDSFEAAIIVDGKVKMQDLRARLVALTAVDEAGERLFTADDVAALGGKSSAALDRCFAVAQRLNGLGNSDVEALTKN